MRRPHSAPTRPAWTCSGCRRTCRRTGPTPSPSAAVAQLVGAGSESLMHGGHTSIMACSVQSTGSLLAWLERWSSASSMHISHAAVVRVVQTISADHLSGTTQQTLAPLMVLTVAGAEPPAVTFSRVTGALAFLSCTRWSPPPQRPHVCVQKPPPTIQAESHLPHACRSSGDQGLSQVGRGRRRRSRKAYMQQPLPCVHVLLSGASAFHIQADSVGSGTPSADVQTGLSSE